MQKTSRETFMLPTNHRPLRGNSTRGCFVCLPPSLDVECCLRVYLNVSLVFSCVCVRHENRVFVDCVGPCRLGSRFLGRRLHDQQGESRGGGGGDCPQDAAGANVFFSMNEGATAVISEQFAHAFIKVQIQCIFVCSSM